METTTNSTFGSPKGSLSRIISLTEMDDVETEINEQSQLIKKQFYATVDTLKGSINVQLSSIEMQLNVVILEIRKDVI